MLKRLLLVLCIGGVCVPLSFVRAQEAPAQKEPTQEEPKSEPAPKETTEQPASDIAEQKLESVTIIGASQDLKEATGSAHVLDEEFLEQREYDDIHRVLKHVPGVYLRGEDGYGLRPNIGIRGANSNRSSKVTLMEDGVLFAPAPYAAPAAYYFPLMTRLTAVEVFKGPSSIRYGPHTIGGAINLATRTVPYEWQGTLDAAIGGDFYRKLHGYVGNSWDGLGFIAEGALLGTDGFKDLDGGGDTGFQKYEFMLKGMYEFDIGASAYHRFELKLGAASEESDETYLGLTDGDFNASPSRRYAGSQNDRMIWERYQYQLSHYMAIGDNFELTTTAYFQDFSRSWTKLNRFQNAELFDVITNPGTAQNAVLLEVLRGNQDSFAASETLLVGENARDFISNGIQVDGRLWFDIDAIENELQFGVRYHGDRVSRVHTEDGFLMQSGRLVSDGGATTTTTRNIGSAQALAVYLQNTMRYEDWIFTPGVRMELIEMEFKDRLAGTVQDSSQSAFIPGVGVYYQASDWAGVFAGVHKGFSPIAPGQDDSVDPEESVNYEIGGRLAYEKSSLELVGFYNDYSNLTAIGTFSGGATNNQLGQQFNGGEVDILGFELAARHEFDFGTRLRFPVDLSYTYTHTEFLNDFLSANAQFGQVEEGDRLPYVPEHQAALTFGVLGESWSAEFTASYVGTMLEAAGTGNDPGDLNTDPHFVFDFAAHYWFLDGFDAYFKADNIFDEDYIVSRRPYGARPGKPLQLIVGLKYKF